jgi:hypothetical protein
LAMVVKCFIPGAKTPSSFVTSMVGLEFIFRYYFIKLKEYYTRILAFGMTY